ncbi:hypothetical protein JW752_04285 [Candidatus Peregrinibacteria bacterium]|nr:hypothetical protein [Candidatus Peregrinibacteria bacterium]
MPKKAAKFILAPSAPVEIPGEIKVTEPCPESGFGDTCNIVVPIRENLQEVILAKLEEDLKWNQSIINCACVNDAPSWTGRVKRAYRAIEAIQKRIKEIKAEIKE